MKTQNTLKKYIISSNFFDNRFGVVADHHLRRRERKAKRSEKSEQTNAAKTLWRTI